MDVKIYVATVSLKTTKFSLFHRASFEAILNNPINKNDLLRLKITSKDSWSKGLASTENRVYEPTFARLRLSCHMSRFYQGRGCDPGNDPEDPKSRKNSQRSSKVTPK